MNLQYAEALKAKAAGRRNEAIDWFTKAANGGKVEAMLALGDLYNGGETQEDGAKAVSWYEKAAKEGNVEAMRKLGICYQTGRGGKTEDF
ncbi:MAG TPA: hypothetical protein VG839_06900, partial [Asticcacaulis sp.]|nr:hypothetical protein [Asticcacaulis sp.]